MSTSSGFGSAASNDVSGPEPQAAVRARRSVKLWAINAGCHTLAFTLFGLVFGLWH